MWLWVLPSLSTSVSSLETEGSELHWPFEGKKTNPAVPLREADWRATSSTQDLLGKHLRSGLQRRTPCLPDGLPLRSRRPQGQFGQEPHFSFDTKKTLF